MTRPWMKIFPTEMKLCCRMLGTAIRLMRPSMFQENSSTRPCVSIDESRFLRAFSASIQAMPCAMKVAQATPATSQWKTATKIRSSTIFPREEPIRKYRGVLESPMELKIPVATLYRKRNIKPPM